MNREATAMVQTREEVDWTRRVAWHLVRDELQGLDPCVGGGGDEVKLVGQCLAHGGRSINIK